MATFNPPPMPLDQWNRLMEFDRKVKAETGHSFIDHETLKTIHAYNQGSRAPPADASIRMSGAVHEEVKPPVE